MPLTELTLVTSRFVKPGFLSYNLCESQCSRVTDCELPQFLAEPALAKLFH